MSGETRNIIRDFFNSEKKLIGRCQILDCDSSGQIDTVHLKEDRPKLFLKSAAENKIKLKTDFFKFDVYATMKSFLEKHSDKKSICFLCKGHHNQLHKLEKLNNKTQLNTFLKKIILP